ncbi:MAG: Connector [Bacteriophage sp.]|nr:MAG: Connector [Bacteriophage sp.]
MYKRQLLTLAENVFEFTNMPKFIDTAYLNKTLLRQGSIAFFVDEVLGLLALPYQNIGKLDVYGRPTSIQVISQNGYSKLIKSQDDFVIMYDNNGRYPLWLDILQYVERISLDTRVTDINIRSTKDTAILENKIRKSKINTRFSK